MKKLFLISLLIIGFQMIAQEAVHFNMHYKPDTKYISETNLSLEATTIHSGSDSYMRYLKEAGIDTISKSYETMNIKMELKVLSKDQQGVSSAEMKYISLETNGIENTFVTGMTAVGTIEGNNLPVFTSLKDSNFDTHFEKEFIQGVNQMFEQIKFPNVVLEIGDIYEDSMPFVMPTGNLEMNMDLNSIYKLKEVKGNRALIELTQMGGINFSEDGNDYSGEYKGQGYFFYNLNFDIIEESTLKYSFNVDYFSNYYNFQIIIDANYFQKFEIEKM